MRSTTMTDVQRGMKLREMRESARLNQSDVGKVLGIGKQAVSSWETGKSKPTIENLTRLDVLVMCDLTNPHLHG